MKILALLCLLFCPITLFAQQVADNSNLRKVSLTIPAEQLIRNVSTKESLLAKTRNEYLFLQEVKGAEIGLGGYVIGEFYRVSEITFDDSGKRNEKIIRFPPTTIQGVQITMEDLAGFATVQPFALTVEELPNYQVTYLGKEKIDELDTYVFDIVPKFMIPINEKLKRGKKISESDAAGAEGRAFEGRVWVDDQDLQIVKTAGHMVPQVKQRFPKFESYRENIDGKYWFPTYVYSDDVLSFEGDSVHLRFEVKYTKYRRFSGSIEILDDDEEVKPKKTVPPKKPEKPEKP